MGTRGFVGFVVDGTEKIAYNHWDSYPSGLGVDVLKWLRDADLNEARTQAAALRVVDANSTPTDEDIERLRQYADTNVSTRELTEWYVLLHNTQGDPAAILAAGVIEDGSGYGGQEYGYLVDFDANRLVVHDGNRAAPVLGSWSLTDLPEDDAFLRALKDD